MKRDKKWLKVEIKNILRNQVAITSEGSSIYYVIEKKIDELYESEVKQLDKKIKELDSYNDELIRDNNQLRNELDTQEVLSQEWIGEHKYNHYIGKPFVYVDDLKNLIVPKQEEVTEKPVEAVKGYFKSVEKAKEVLEELGYVVSEKPTEPVIPQFVADFIEKWKYKGLTMYEWFSFDNNDVDDDVNKWLYNNLNVENRRREYLLIDAIRFGYKVEKEPVYYAKIKGHELVQRIPTFDEDTGENTSDYYRSVYFVRQSDGDLIVDMKDSGLSGAKHVMTMSQWNDLGINDGNADFEEVN